MAKLNSLREAIPSGGRGVFTAYNKKIADDIATKLAQPRKMLTPSSYQQAVFDWVLHGGHLSQKNAVVEAVAGSGKTTTMIEVCRLLNMQVFSATFHSIGLRAWQTVCRPQVKGEKIEDLMEEEDVPRHMRAVVGKLVSLAKQRGVGIRGLVPATEAYDEYVRIIEHFDLEELIPAFTPIHDVVMLADLIRGRSVDSADRVIDFEDMIYMPLQAGVAIPQYDWVIVDELQDTNPTRRELARRMIGPGGRFIGVGDPHQAIYGFTGADNDAMDLVVKQFDCIRLPLTVTYRCAKSIVAHAQQWVSHIEPHEGASQGVVRNIKLKEFNEILELTKALKNPAVSSGAVITTADAILCRNTRPLIETAFDMIRRRIPCHVEGRDIGQGLISLIKKWKSVRTVGQLRNQLEEHLEAETTKFLKRGRRDKIASLEDKVGTLMVFMASLHDDDNLYKLIESINSLFKDTETGKKAATVTLSTVHKSKGREWDRVFLLGRNALMPSPYAKQPWQLQQEQNLIYVAVTRAMTTLVEVDFPLPGEEEKPIRGASGMYIGEGNEHIAEKIADNVSERYGEALNELSGVATPRPAMLEAPNFEEQSKRAAEMNLDDWVGIRLDATVKDGKLTSLKTSDLQLDINKRKAVKDMETFLRSHGVARDSQPNFQNISPYPEGVEKPRLPWPSEEDKKKIADQHSWIDERYADLEFDVKNRPEKYPELGGVATPRLPLPDGSAAAVEAMETFLRSYNKTTHQEPEGNAAQEAEYLRLMDDMRANGYHEGSD